MDLWLEQAFLILISHFCESWTLRRVICICPFPIVPSLHDVQNCGYVFIPSCLCWHPLVSGNKAAPLARGIWHMTGGHHTCVSSMWTCVLTVSVSLWHFWNNPTYLPCPGRLQSCVCVGWWMAGLAKNFMFTSMWSCSTCCCCNSASALHPLTVLWNSPGS